MDYQKYILPHIWDLKPYSSARDEFKGSEGVFLDANENPMGSATKESWNRYPDPLQHAIKLELAKLKSCSSDQIFLGNGSDEAIDLLIRMTCKSAEHEIILCPPTYGMYEVSASINDIKIQRVNLTSKYQLDLSGIKKAIQEKTRLIFLCSPNNPTGNKLNRSDIYDLLNTYSQGFIIVDEAYIDFSDEPSFIHELNQFPQLIVLQTLSKAYGLASLRLGMAFAHPSIIQLFNKIKPPYNISGATQKIVLEALSNQKFVGESVQLILQEKIKLQNGLNEIKEVVEIFPSQANFILVKFNKAQELFDYLISEKVITRNRSNVSLCEDSIRITIGLAEENTYLVKKITDFYA
jgi:histidinol-phosphate aminotransferase